MGSGKKAGRVAPWPRVIRYESAIVTVYLRGDGRYLVAWREDGRRRCCTRADEARTLEWAAAKARALGQATGSQWVPPAQAEILQTLRRIAGPGEGAMARLLADVDTARQLLDGRADLATAARWFSQHGPSHATPITVASAVKRFLAEYQGGSKSTQRTFGTELNAFAAKFGERMLDEITETMLRAWVDRRTKPDNRIPAPRTILGRITTLCTMFRRAKDWGVLPESGKSAPEKLRRPKIPHASRTILTLDQASALLAAVRAKQPKLEMFLLLGGWAGLRPSEAVKVLAGDFDLDGGYLHATTGTVLKTGQERFVPLDPRLVARLRVLLADRRAEERVCVYRSREYLSVLARAQGIVDPWPVDVLRHSYCSYRLAIVGDMGRVAEEAGNSPKMIRDHYRRPVKKEAGFAWWALLE